MTAASIQVDSSDRVAEARRSGVTLAARLNLDETAAARTALVVTEAATNLWKHAGGGEILLIPGQRAGEIEILALDKGPGMADIERCFQDGYSTAGSPGTGLGAIRRLSFACDVHSEVGKGTVLLARMRAASRRDESLRNEPRLGVGGISVPKPGETACGDSYAVHHGRGFTSILVVDGLGHGEMAAAAAAAATQAFAEKPEEEPAEMMAYLHGAMRATRGAAAAVARFDYSRREVRFSGIGNIAGAILAGTEARHFTSQPGIVGHNTRHVREFTYAWPPDALALLYSDGIATHWSILRYEGLLLRDPLLVAGVLYRDWKRERDDSTILAAREVPAQ